MITAPPELLAWVAVVAACVTSLGAIIIAIINRRVPEVPSKTEEATAAAALIAAATENQNQFIMNVIKDNAEVRGALTAKQLELNAYITQTQADRQEWAAERARQEKEITRLARKLALTDVETNGTH